MAPSKSQDTDYGKSASPELKAAIDKTFGSKDDLEKKCVIGRLVLLCVKWLLCWHSVLAPHVPDRCNCTCSL